MEKWKLRDRVALLDQARLKILLFTVDDRSFDDEDETQTCGFWIF